MSFITNKYSYLWRRWLIIAWDFSYLHLIPLYVYQTLYYSCWRYSVVFKATRQTDIAPQPLFSVEHKNLHLRILFHPHTISKISSLALFVSISFNLPNENTCLCFFYKSCLLGNISSNNSHRPFPIATGAIMWMYKCFSEILNATENIRPHSSTNQTNVVVISQIKFEFMKFPFEYVTQWRLSPPIDMASIWHWYKHSSNANDYEVNSSREFHPIQPFFSILNNP